MEWQPIETAPHDGTSVLAWIPHPHSGWVEIVWWDGRFFDAARYLDTYEQPSHWMPLPDPPKE